MYAFGIGDHIIEAYIRIPEKAERRKHSNTNGQYDHCLYGGIFAVGYTAINDAGDAAEKHQQSKAEKKADEKLTSALNAYKHGNYDEAKRQINSIKTLYPKAFEARKAGQDLMLDVEQNAQKQKLDSLNDLLRIHLEALDAMKGDYTLEKDTAYQEIGNYLWPTQVIEKNLHRSFLRFQTDERGMLSMTSIYCGGNNIHHSSIKATLPDGTFAETPVSHDRYETTDLDEKIENPLF